MRRRFFYQDSAWQRSAPSDPDRPPLMIKALDTWLINHAARSTEQPNEGSEAPDLLLEWHQGSNVKSPSHCDLYCQRGQKWGADFSFFFCCDTGKIASFWWSCAVAMQIYDVTRWPRRPHPVIQPYRHLRPAANRAQRKSPNDTVRPDSLPFPPRETDVQPKAEKQLQLQLRLVRLHSTQGFRHDVCFNISLWSKYRSLSAIAAE